MTQPYTTDQLLPLSGIQHFVFCRRQWALIHVERQWQENALTAQGRIVHQRVDDPFFTEARKGLVVARSVPVSSYTLGLTGVCDVVEFRQSPQGFALPGRDGLYQCAPVEYKRGQPKQTPADEVQLTAQAMCLEEMLLTAIPTGYLYYAQTRHRLAIDLTPERREFVRQMAAEMHNYFARGHTPRVKPFKGCRSCSLAEVCLPALERKAPAASYYIEQYLKEN